MVVGCRALENHFRYLRPTKQNSRSRQERPVIPRRLLLCVAFNLTTTAKARALYIQQRLAQVKNVQLDNFFLKPILFIHLACYFFQTLSSP